MIKNPLETPLVHPEEGPSASAKMGGVEDVALLSFREDAKRQSLDQFVKSHPSPVLLVCAPVPDAQSEQTTSMHTRPKDPSIQVLDLTRLTKNDLSYVRAYILRKERTRFGEAIWIGRWAKCDISIERATLSRLHAFITTDAEGKAFLGDGGSKNGTFVDGTRIQKGVTVQLPEDSYVTLGTVSVRFLQPRALYRELQTLVSRLG